MTYFDECAEYGFPRHQVTRFTVAGVNYEVNFTQITHENPYDCAALFPEGFTFPLYGHHYDVTFDTIANRINKTPFKRAEELPTGAGCRVLKCVERIITEHYTHFNVGLYTFAPADHKLLNIYCRLITKKKHKGLTIEVGLEPNGRANVLRTPKFWGLA
ncbi:hypothetical protein [Enterobacter sp. Colony194]|uniref:hypothetical protein n=1 Tax=Enterobacter sp. Colony194 TaxID=2866201 RepID=UPI001C6A6964|nr:hypothetical protein [Enterobacter sp. Colony194]